MSLDVRPMHAYEAEAVSGMVRGLAEHIGTDFVPALTGEKLRTASDLIDVVVADDGGRLIGACLGLMTFSTWRGAPGLYVVDLFVLPEARGRNVGLELLRCQARRFAARMSATIRWRWRRNRTSSSSASPAARRSSISCTANMACSTRCAPA